MHFRATVILGGKTATGIQVPDGVVEQLGAGKRPPVRVTINGYTYRTTVAPMGGAFWIPLSAEHRTGAGTAAGEEVTVEMALDTEPRAVEVPADLAAALAADPAAQEAFERLSYSNQRRHVLAVEDAKTPETRQRRVEKVVATLQDGGQG
jgi:hypothetical protein